MVDKKMAVMLRFQGLSYKEIAKQLGCSESWCKANLAGVDKAEFLIDNGTKYAAVAILRDALARLEAL